MAKQLEKYKPEAVKAEELDIVVKLRINGSFVLNKDEKVLILARPIITKNTVRKTKEDILEVTDSRVPDTMLKSFDDCSVSFYNDDKKQEVLLKDDDTLVNYDDELNVENCGLCIDYPRLTGSKPQGDPKPAEMKLKFKVNAPSNEPGIQS